MSTKAEVARAFNKTVQPFYFRLCWKCQRYTDFPRWLGNLGDTPSGGPKGPNDGSFEVALPPLPNVPMCTQATPSGHSHPPRTRHMLHPSTATAASTMVAIHLIVGLPCVLSRIWCAPKRQGAPLLAAVESVWLVWGKGGLRREWFADVHHSSAPSTSPGDRLVSNHRQPPHCACTSVT